MARTAGAEKGFGKFFDDGGIVPLATENIEVGAVGIVGEVTADQRGFNQLHHTIAGHAPFPEMNDLAGAIPFHLNQFAELNDIGLYLFGIADAVRDAIVKVNGSANSPGFAGPDGVRVDRGISNPG
ncbi:MAG: hypothetical protein K0S45_1259 [Nitrospira sp.]|nr:hypothetical protein [Nitrospira sp.]